MITTNAAYLHCLSYGQALQKVIAGTALTDPTVNPVLKRMSVSWANTIYGKLTVTVNQWIALHPTSTSASQVVTSF